MTSRLGEHNCWSAANASPSPLRLRPRARPEVGSRLDRVLEQRSLADARLAVHRQHTAVSSARSLQQAVECDTLALPAEQLHCGCPDDHCVSMPPGSRTTGFQDASALPGGRRCPRSPQFGKESG